MHRAAKQVNLIESPNPDLLVRRRTCLAVRPSAETDIEFSAVTKAVVSSDSGID
jgi:hypothetical protein